MKRASKLLIFIGIVGILIVFGLNIYSGYAANIRIASLFSTNWWVQWFPLYASVASLLLIGLVLRMTSNTR